MTDVVKTENKRGPKPGTKNMSKDHKAFLALQDIDFATHFAAMPTGGNWRNMVAWQNSIIGDIVSALRDGDDPVF